MDPPNTRDYLVVSGPPAGSPSVTPRDRHESEEDPSHASIADSAATSNLLSPISSIPSEILLTIFFLLGEKSKDPARPWSGDDTVTLHGIVVASHVCRLWREVVLSSGALWASNINWDLRYPLTWWREIVKRTGDADIDFACTTTGRYPLDASSQQGRCVPNLKDVARERVRSLQLSIHDYPRWSPQTRTMMNEELSGPFPFLQVLSLSRAGQMGSYMADSATRLDSFSFLETHPKRLRVLYLKTFNLDFNHLPTFYNLRKLSVIDVKYRPPTLGNWLNLLRVMPHLVYLAIMNSISPSTPSTDVGQRVPLPNLSVLSLMGEVGGQGGIDSLLSYIDTPKGCNLYFAGRFKNMTAAFNDAGLVAWFERWNDEDYKSRALHARFSMGQLIMHNQSGQKPQPGLWFNVYFVNYFSVGADNSRYVQYIRQAAASLVSALTPVISRTERLSLSWTRTSSYPDVAYPYQDFLPSFLPLFRSLQMLHIAVKDRERRPYSPEHLSEILGPFMVQNAIRWAELRCAFPDLQEMTVSKDGDIIERVSCSSVVHA